MLQHFFLAFNSHSITHSNSPLSAELSEKTLQMATSVRNEVIKCRLSSIRLSNLFLHETLDILLERQKGSSTDAELLANGIKNNTC